MCRNIFACRVRRISFYHFYGLIQMTFSYLLEVTQCKIFPRRGWKTHNPISLSFENISLSHFSHLAILLYGLITDVPFESSRRPTYGRVSLSSLPFPSSHSENLFAVHVYRLPKNKSACGAFGICPAFTEKCPGDGWRDYQLCVIRNGQFWTDPAKQ